jgi:amidophosphoribosyltransferase
MKIGEECGIFGGISHKSSIAPFIRTGLFALQHRGQESAGMCYGDKDLAIIKNNGLVMEVLADKAIQNVHDRSGIGHVRYSTQGASDTLHAQPYMIKHLGERVAIAHNGNVQSAIKMRSDLEKKGEVFLTSSDTEMILKKVIRDIRKPSSKWTFQEIGKILKDNFTGGAWSILFAFPGKVMAFRDPLGFRPLMLCDAQEGIFVASEDSAFQLLDVKHIIEIEPGEGVEITSEGYKITRFAKQESHKKCVFEHIYFARPDSNIFGRNVYNSRVEIGKRCAIESPVDADIVVPVMDSGFAAAIGYSQQSGIPLQMGLLRNHWVGRTFIKPQQEDRRNSVREKLCPITEVIAGKKIVLVDDSLVRGTTSREIVRILKKAGAKEVHLRIASPMLVNVCYWGVDIPTKEELIANSFTNVEKINNYIESDSLAYISFDGLKEIFGSTGWCYRCFERI